MVRSSRLRAWWQRPGSKHVVGVCVGWESSRTRPVTYKAIRIAVVGLLMAATPSRSRAPVTWRYNRRLVRYRRAATEDTSVGTCELATAISAFWRRCY